MRPSLVGGFAVPALPPGVMPPPPTRAGAPPPPPPEALRAKPPSVPPAPPRADIRPPLEIPRAPSTVPPPPAAVAQPFPRTPSSHPPPAAAVPSREAFDVEERVTALLPSQADIELVRALRAAGLVAELDETELERIVRAVGSSRGLTRRVDLIECYYRSNGDVSVSRRRCGKDRFFVHRAEEDVTASELVNRFARLVPELPEVQLERIGSDDGPLVLRSGEQLSAVFDDLEEAALDTGEIDLSTLDESTVTIRGIVQALNVLLDRAGVRHRLVPLRSDAAREVYVGVGVTEAVALAQAGHLEDDDPETVMELGSW